MTDGNQITIDALLKRINRKLAPHGRIRQSSHEETGNGFGLWFVTENGKVKCVFKYHKELVKYAVELSVIDSNKHVLQETHTRKLNGCTFYTGALAIVDNTNELISVRAALDQGYSLDPIKTRKQQALKYVASIRENRTARQSTTRR